MQALPPLDAVPVGQPLQGVEPPGEDCPAGHELHEVAPCTAGGTRVRKHSAKFVSSKWTSQPRDRRASARLHVHARSTQNITKRQRCDWQRNRVTIFDSEPTFPWPRSADKLLQLDGRNWWRAPVHPRTDASEWTWRRNPRTVRKATDCNTKCGSPADGATEPPGHGYPTTRCEYTCPLHATPVRHGRLLGEKAAPRQRPDLLDSQALQNAQYYRRCNPPGSLARALLEILRQCRPQCEPV